MTTNLTRQLLGFAAFIAIVRHRLLRRSASRRGAGPRSACSPRSSLARRLPRVAEAEAGMTEHERPRYMISIAAELVGMHPQTLRVYEQKGLVRPRRTAGNTRLYSESRRGAAAADPAADDRARAQPRRRRARAAPGGRAQARARPDRAARAPACATRSRTSTRQYRRDLVLYRQPEFPGNDPEKGAHGLPEADPEEPGGRRRSAGAGAPGRQPRDPPRAPAARAPRSGAAAHARRARRLVAGCAARRGGAAPARPAVDAGRRRTCSRRSRTRVPQGARRRLRRRRSKLEDEYVSTEHLLLALDVAAARAAARRAAGRPRRPARHVAGSRGHLPGAREVRPRPDRARRAGQARPGHRPRRGDPPRHPGAVAAHEEQPGADRRPGRRQDGDRRGARAADRRRRRARGR